MSEEDKQASVLAADGFKEAVAAMLTDVEDERVAVVASFPEPTGLGTDGTCWSDAEHVAFYLKIVSTAGSLLRRAAKEIS